MAQLVELQPHSSSNLHSISTSDAVLVGVIIHVENKVSRVQMDA